jgi:hypothetical protein
VEKESEQTHSVKTSKMVKENLAKSDRGEEEVELMGGYTL